MMKENNPTTPPLTIDFTLENFRAIICGRPDILFMPTPDPEQQLRLVARDFLNSYTAPSVLYVPNIPTADIPTSPQSCYPAVTPSTAPSRNNK